MRMQAVLATNCAGHLQISDRVCDYVAFHNENSISGELGEVHLAVMLYILIAALVHARVVKANLMFASVRGQGQGRRTYSFTHFQEAT